MRFVVGGASGFLGRAWTSHLQAAGHSVTRLVRRPAGSGESRWDPYADKVDLDLVEQADVVACLSGAALAHWPYTKRYQRVFQDSRVVPTSVLARAVAEVRSQPVFLAQNATAGYGDQGDAVVTEESPYDADTFFGRITRAWEAATTPAEEAGGRVVVLRSAPVLDRSGGAFRVMLPAFKLGVGGTLGSGGQYFPTISLTDWLRAATWLAERSEAAGIYNLTGPGTTTNAELTRMLGRLLRRPTVLPLPERLLRLVAGPPGPELFNSTRLEPARLLREGFEFRHADLESRLRAALGGD